jgi:isopenicillin N synthase-like dioxygenase
VLREIPRVELVDATAASATRRRAFTETVERGLREIGFVFVRTPDVARMLPAAYAAYADVFTRDADELERYRRPEIHHLRGYTPLGVETAAACRRSGVDGEPQSDHRSCWLVGPESVADPDLRGRFPAFYADNVWPDDAPAFRDNALAVFDALNDVGLAILRALEPRLGYAGGFFADLTRDASTALRPLCYPPITAEQIGRVVWGCRHTDANLVSILPPSTGKEQRAVGGCVSDRVGVCCLPGAGCVGGGRYGPGLWAGCCRRTGSLWSRAWHRRRRCGRIVVRSGSRSTGRVGACTSPTGGFPPVRCVRVVVR